MKSLPLTWIDDITTTTLTLCSLVVEFFSNPRAQIDYRDGTVYNGRQWADEDETAEFHRWVESRR